MENLRTLNRLIVGAASLAFVLAVVTAFGVDILRIPAESFSRACSNLALLALALHFTFGD